ncbi:hypothetical protein BU16DRAFT_545572 [Lophium mytilinum]|uniref:Uncharacterized protein n=1 Tax=Lophium mytilinum TaxID=390894 RepID=A0A6A6Q8C7_9PEZI|nr:hypothetical protein BU16DRAFT_545572 [Lophium mytilinum]
MAAVEIIRDIATGVYQPTTADDALTRLHEVTKTRYRRSVPWYGNLTARVEAGRATQEDRVDYDAIDSLILEASGGYRHAIETAMLLALAMGGDIEVHITAAKNANRLQATEFLHDQLLELIEDMQGVGQTLGQILRDIDVRCCSLMACGTVNPAREVGSGVGFATMVLSSMFHADWGAEDVVERVQEYVKVMRPYA